MDKAMMEDRVHSYMKLEQRMYLIPVELKVLG